MGYFLVQKRVGRFNSVQLQLICKYFLFNKRKVFTFYVLVREGINFQWNWGLV